MWTEPKCYEYDGLTECWENCPPAPYECGKDDKEEVIWSELKCKSEESWSDDKEPYEWCFEWCRPRPYDCADGSRTEETCDDAGLNCGYWCKDAKEECSW
jgi:hypothetical protein